MTSAAPTFWPIRATHAASPAHLTSARSSWSPYIARVWSWPSTPSEVLRDSVATTRAAIPGSADEPARYSSTLTLRLGSGSACARGAAASRGDDDGRRRGESEGEAHHFFPNRKVIEPMWCSSVSRAGALWPDRRGALPVLMSLMLADSTPSHQLR